MPLILPQCRHHAHLGLALYTMLPFVCCFLASLALPAVALAAPGAKGASAAQLGSLQRTAAAVDDALDVYRLALLELVPALRQVADVGAQQGSTPSTLVPEVAQEVFTRLSTSVQRRVNAGALPAVPRAYHAEVVDALEKLATAPNLSAVPAPAKALHTALSHLALTADEVVDVFSRQRPALTEVLDPATALDDISEALDQLGLAEANIATVRAHKGSSGEQLQAFLRLEIALGHALDLIAAAEEQGIHVGFEMQLSTVGLARRLAAVHGHLAQLQDILQIFAREPHAVGQDLQVELQDRPDGTSQAQLTWTPPSPGHGAPALLRIYRRNNLTGMSARLSTSLRCEGHPAQEAQSAAQAAVAPLGDASERLVDLPAGRGAWNETFKPAPAAPPLYRLVAVTPFGVESKSQEHAALSVPYDLSPPLLVSAEAMAPSPDSPTFYHDADAITLTWQPSLSDVSGISRAQDYAEAHHLPVLTRYDVYRLEGNAPPQVIAHVPAGMTSWIDRPSVALLRAGVRYAVTAVDSNNQQARGAQACAASNLVQLDLQPALEEAQAGAAYLTHPTNFETQTSTMLGNPEQLARERDAFAKREAPQRESLMARWWSRQSTMQRVAWLQAWPSYFSETERTAWLQDAPNNLRSRDLIWARAAVWFAQNPVLRGEVERYWRLLDEAAHRTAMQNWRSHLNRAYLAWLNDRIRTADGKQKDELEQPGRLLAWWQGRDAEEQERLGRWWDELPAETRTQALKTWFDALPTAAQVSVAWPDWEQLTQAERDPWLQSGYKTLPALLWPNFLAWLHWEELDSGTRARLIRDQVGLADASWSWLHFALRPVDMWLDFKGVLAILVVSLGALSGFLLQYASRHQLSDPND